MDTDLSFLNLSFGAEFHDTGAEGICYNVEDTFEDPAGDFGLEFPSTVLNDLDKQGESDVLNELLNVDSSIEECKKICVVCKKTFNKIKQYHGHLRIHAKQGIWLCDKCPELRFKSRVDLSKHSSKHQYHCYLCNQCFSAHSALVTHILNLHYKQRLHKCDQCDASFQKTYDLKKHMDIHKGKKKHVCGRCLKKFSDVSNLYTHMLTHQDEKIFACGSCKRKYAQLSGLVRHCKSRNHIYNYSRTKQCNVHANPMIAGSSDNQQCDSNSKKPDNTLQGISDLGRNVDNLINDILSADTNKKIVNDTCVNVNDKGLLNNNITPDKHKVNDLLENSDATAENLLQIELFEEMNKLHGLINTNTNDISNIDPENLIPSEFFDGKIEHLLDFENFQTTNGTDIPNAEIDTLGLDRNVPKFEEDIFNTWCQTKDDRIPEDILNMVDEHTRKIDEKNQSQENDYISNSLAVPKLASNLICSTFEIPKQMTHDTNVIENYKSLNNDWQHMKPEVKSSNQISIANPVEVVLSDPSLAKTNNNKTELTNNLDEFSKNICISIDSSMTSPSTDKCTKTAHEKIMKVPLKLSVGTEKHGCEMRIIIEPVCANNPKSVLITNTQVSTKEHDITTKLVEAVDSSKVSENFKVNLDDTLKSNASEQTNKAVQVEDCATIFESDVDLEARSDLAHNLTQLIGKNHVQYISNEEDDTFVIVLNNNIDAEKLTDILFHEDANREQNLLPIDIDANKNSMQEIKNDVKACIELNSYNETLNSTVKNISRSKKESKTLSIFKCKYCNKNFFKKDNWRSHIATHVPKKSQFRCVVCGLRFAWRATLTKHMNRLHVPRVLPAFGCRLCDRQYRDEYRLRQHVSRDHLGAKPYACAADGCGRKFFKKHDLTVHHRSHAKARPYECVKCSSKFGHVSHLRRHERICRSSKDKISPDADGTLVIFLGDVTAQAQGDRKVK